LVEHDYFHWIHSPLRSLTHGINDQIKFRKLALRTIMFTSIENCNKQLCVFDDVFIFLIERLFKSFKYLFWTEALCNSNRKCFTASFDDIHFCWLWFVFSTTMKVFVKEVIGLNTIHKNKLIKQIVYIFIDHLARLWKSRFFFRFIPAKMFIRCICFIICENVRMLNFTPALISKVYINF